MTKKRSIVKVISINDVKKNSQQELEQELEKRKTNMLDIVDHLRKEIEDGKILEFTATSLDLQGECQIHCYVGDVAAGIGMFEIGKNILMTQYDPE